MSKISRRRTRYSLILVLYLIMALIILTGCGANGGLPGGEVVNDYREYEITYYCEYEGEKVWMPVPQNWSGPGVLDVEIKNIEPEPTESYTDNAGTKIAYWRSTDPSSNTYQIKFRVKLNHIYHNLDAIDYNPDYNTGSELYKKYTSATAMTQSDAGKIIDKANSITENNEDPVAKIKAINNWVGNNIESTGNTSYEGLPDALKVLKYREGECGAFANIFTALSRAADIPARNVSVLHHPDASEFKSGSHGDTFWGHIITEFYLENYGWVQLDPGQEVGVINEDMIILSKGNVFELRESDFGKKHLWFHMPVINTGDQEATTMEVKRLQ